MTAFWRLAMMVLVLSSGIGAREADAQTRRAFLVGINSYSDGNLLKLQRAVADSKGVESDLQQVGFDKKNIKRIENIKTKAAFDKEFDAFLKTVQPGDSVVFFFSGHGFGVDLRADNYLLMGDLKSPFAFTQAKLPAEERKNAAVVRLRIASVLDDYKETEVPRAGVSASEIREKIAARKPKSAIIILDACRSLVTEDALDSKNVKRSADSGSRLLPARNLPPGFLVLYSASFGEQAAETLRQFDRRQNSLFTEVLRQELMRPGQTAVEFAERVKLVTRAVALKYGLQQEPEFFHAFDKSDDFYFIDPIGRDRFQRIQQACEVARSDLDDIKKQPLRDALERHRRRYRDCATADEARRILDAIALGSDEQVDRCEGSRVDLINAMRQGRVEALDRHSRRFEGCATAEAAAALGSIVVSPAGKNDVDRTCLAKFAEITKQPQRGNFDKHLHDFPGCATAPAVKAVLAALPPGSDELDDKRITLGTLRRIDDCDYFAASEQDKARPAEVSGVFFPHVKFDDAIEACEKSVKDNPRITRFMFNLGRAYHRKGWDPATDARQRGEIYLKASSAYSDAEKRGYVSALNGLAVLYQAGALGDNKDDEVARLLKQATQQGHALAMYNLAVQFLNGTSAIQRDLFQAYELFARAAESDYVPAMVETGWALYLGRGVPANPKRAVEILNRAADAGSVSAKRILGIIYYNGGYNSDLGKSVEKDRQLSLLWYSRAADAGDSNARKWVGKLLDDGEGLPKPEPELAERYWRLAAYGGDVEAQFVFGEKLKNGNVLARPENGVQEALQLLERAMAQGSAPAALKLAETYRNGDLDQPRDPVKAIEFAFRAIALATQTPPLEWDGSPFYEIAAGHLLAEMARGGEAVDSRGRPLLSEEEIVRIEIFYGKPDAESRKVKTRRVVVPFNLCTDLNNRINRFNISVWVWDWGRPISPTELQIQQQEHVYSFFCTNNTAERATLIASFEMAKKTKIAFADLLDQQIRAARLAQETKKNSKK